jgi:hypothetical protein
VTPKPGLSLRASACPAERGCRRPPSLPPAGGPHLWGPRAPRAGPAPPRPAATWQTASQLSRFPPGLGHPSHAAGPLSQEYKEGLHGLLSPPQGSGGPGEGDRNSIRRARRRSAGPQAPPDRARPPTTCQPALCSQLRWPALGLETETPAYRGGSLSKCCPTEHSTRAGGAPARDPPATPGGGAGDASGREPGTLGPCAPGDLQCDWLPSQVATGKGPPDMLGAHTHTHTHTHTQIKLSPFPIWHIS